MNQYLVGNYRIGFTIVELLIVIVVIAVLATITIVSYNGIQVRAQAALYESNAQSIAKKVEIFYQQTGGYPTPSNPLPTNQDAATLPSNLRITFTSVGTASMVNRVGSVTTDPPSNDTANRNNAIYRNTTTGTLTYTVRECTAGTGLRIFYANLLDPGALNKKYITLGSGCT